MSPLQCIVLCEYTIAGLPHGGSSIRLLQPLSHPSIQRRIAATPVTFYSKQKADIVIVDRQWHAGVTDEIAAALIGQIRTSGAKLVYQIDDDLLHHAAKDNRPEKGRSCVPIFLEQADGVIVSTPALRHRYLRYNPRVHLIRNALDERLLTKWGGSDLPHMFHSKSLTLGYMGTMTHDDDLMLVLPALAEIGRISPYPIELQIIGGIYNENIWQKVNSLPFPVRRIERGATEYPQFLPWFTSNVRWDIALAPLVDTPFNRAKSDIKFLDYAALGAPGIYSHLPVYAESVRQGETGLLTDNDTASWVKALRSMIEQPELRRELAANARRYLYNERILAVRAVEWADALEAIWGG